MPAYHQIGHHSENLLFEAPLSTYAGAVLSPVNYTQLEVVQTIEKIKGTRPDFEFIFDPQLYYPKSAREILRNWSYFPNDVDTIDLANSDWWNQLASNVAQTALDIHATAVCSPVIHPRVFSLDYFQSTTKISNQMKSILNGSPVKVFQTALVSLSDLANRGQALAIASVLSQTLTDSIYLIFYDDTAPRRELNDAEELKGAMLLISNLESGGVRVCVAYTSSDMILWKQSGATSCATGKFFNLRRFTPTRWAEADDGGGGQLPYIFEEGLLAFLRESDIKRAIRTDLISNKTVANPYYQEIVENMNTGIAWLGLGWRFWMSWFSITEQQISQNQTDPVQLIQTADANWGRVENEKIIFEERQNNGSWLREWLRAVIEYKQDW